MSDTLCSVGLDVGTTSTQLIVSRLILQNRASAFSVPEISIADREVLYRSPVYLTPLLDESHIDGEKVREIVLAEYEKAGITREQVDTGAIIITGETSRKENAEAVLSALSAFAGDFVVATAGPDLESRLAARGAGADAWSEKTGKTVLHMDIGGGTSNLALIRQGEIVDTGCINVGGRLLTYDESHRVLWVSKALQGISSLKPGDTLSQQEAEELSETLSQVLEMAAGRRPPDERLGKLITKEGKLLNADLLKENTVISFSGGVADCIKTSMAGDQFGDIGPSLGRAIRRGKLCEGQYLLGEETIRATVIGAGCHSAQLSGSTVFFQNVQFPLQNLRTVVLSSSDCLPAARDLQKEPTVLMLPELKNPGYESIWSLARILAENYGGMPLFLCLRQDMAGALGQALALLLGKNAEILCIDRVHLGEGSYLDVGSPAGPAIPVVVKTLILEKG